MARVIIAGTRTFDDYKLLCETMNIAIENSTWLRDGIEIVSGGAKGADQLGEKFAKENGYKLTQFLPNWERDGKKAGVYRNTLMARYADILIAFWDGKSKGTKDMITKAQNIGLIVMVKNYAE